MNHTTLATCRATGEPSYRRHRPAVLLLVREQTGSERYQPDRSAQRPAVAEPDPPPEPEPDSVSDWVVVHERIVELSAKRACVERQLCRWLLAAERLGVHARTGYSSLREYASRLVGLSQRQTEERLRVGRALAQLPQLDRALGSGELSFSAVRELSRVTTAETEQEWIDWARDRTSRQIEQAMASRLPGDRPRDRPDPSLVKHRLSFEVRAETMALFRDLQAAVQRDVGSRVDDDTLLYEIARRALGGPGEAGRSSYQVALTVCEVCGGASIDAAGQSHPVDRAVAEMAACDSQQLGAVGGAGATATEADAPSVEGPSVEVHSAEPPSPHVRAPAATERPRRRASQTIPPAVRREVMRRDRERCVVPGCQGHLFLDVHHLDLRSEGGRHDPERMAVLCGSHHRAVHAGSLCIDGCSSVGFTFRHADGTPYGQPLRPAAIDLAQQALSALRSLGFGPSRARALVDAVLRAGAPNQIGAFVRAALEAS
jgi:hypothetical protein